MCATTFFGWLFYISWEDEVMRLIVIVFLEMEMEYAGDWRDVITNGNK